MAKTKIMDVKFHRWLIDAFDKRIQGDYEVESLVTEEDATTMISHAQEFLQEAKRHLK